MPPADSKPRLASHVRCQADPLSGKPLLLHPEGAVELSETAGAVVRLCDGSRSRGEIVAILSAAYEADFEVLKADVDACLEALVARGVIVA